MQLHKHYKASLPLIHAVTTEHVTTKQAPQLSIKITLKSSHQSMLGQLHSIHFTHLSINLLYQFGDYAFTRKPLAYFLQINTFPC